MFTQSEYASTSHLAVVVHKHGFAHVQFITLVWDLPTGLADPEMLESLYMCFNYSHFCRTNNFRYLYIATQVATNPGVCIADVDHHVVLRALCMRLLQYETFSAG